jgi:hypothetical protein
MSVEANTPDNEGDDSENATNPARGAWVSVPFLAAVALSLWSVGRGTAFLYAVAFAFVAATGLPLGLSLFGIRHAAGWVAGALLGYVLTALAWWVIIKAGLPTPLGFLVGWVGAMTLGTTVGSLFARPLVRLPKWTHKHTRVLLLLLLLVPLLVARPFSRIGSIDDHGDARYRAYFTADFVWHMALVSELRKYEQPPRNPYLASQPIHYYWLYFVVPAVAGALTSADAALSLKVNAFAISLLLVAAMYIVAAASRPRWPCAAAVAVFVTVVAASFEGIAALAYVLRRGEPLSAVRNLNVDALSRGLGGLRIDDLPRAMWYTPQHAMAYASGLLGLLIMASNAAQPSRTAVLMSSLNLATSVLLNPFVGGLFCAIYGVGVLRDAVRLAGGAFVSVVLRHGLGLASVMAALAWIHFNGIAEGAGSTLRFGLVGPAANAPLASLILSLGGILAIMAIGLWRHRRLLNRLTALTTAGCAVSLVVMHIVTMSVDLFWVGFRMGHLFLVLAPSLVACALVRLYVADRRTALTIVGLVVALAAPTTVIDAFNAQDTENLAIGPGFHWTVKITPAQQEAFAWIRNNTPPRAIVQAEPLIRGRETWSWIPSFAERRMAAGEPISLMHVPEYDSLSKQVREIYATADRQRAWQLARSLGIDYLYVDDTERLAYPAAAKFNDAPDLFISVFKNDEVQIFAIRRENPE